MEVPNTHQAPDQVVPLISGGVTEATVPGVSGWAQLCMRAHGSIPSVYSCVDLTLFSGYISNFCLVSLWGGIPITHSMCCTPLLQASFFPSSLDLFSLLPAPSPLFPPPSCASDLHRCPACGGSRHRYPSTQLQC